ncbi:MAG: carboxypeptidase regulatory-like domain-containing protein, partial [Candidatus Hydrogenedentota bacterium]
EDGQYRLMVRRNWWYRSFRLEDWPEKPNWARLGVGRQGYFLEAGGSSRRDLPDGKWEWAEYWTPPPDAPPERLLAFHPNYEMGVVEVPLLGVGQVRKDVDIVLYKGSKVSGRVLDDSSQPVSGAEIAIELEPVEGGVLMESDLTNGYGVKDGKYGRWHAEPKKVRSGDDGRFDIRFLREGGYELTATHQDCDPETIQLELVPHQVVEGLEFVLLRRMGCIRGNVVDSNGNPWPHGKVRSSGSHVFYGRGYSAEVKDDGSYELSNMKPGNYTLWLDVSADYSEPEGILWATSLRDVPTGTEGANITVTTFPAGKLRVRVVDEVQQPIEKFHLECCPLSMSYGGSGILPSPLKRAKSEAADSSGFGAYTRDAKYSGILLFKRDIVSESGEFVAERAAPGSYFVLVKADKHGEEFEEVKIEAGAESEVTFELRSLGRLEGVVVSSQGQPLSGVLIRAMKMRDFLNSTELLTRGEWFSAWENVYSLDKTRSGPDGRFALENLEQTEYRVTARDKEGRGVFTDVAIGESGRDFVELVLHYGSSSIQGFVYGEDGGPVSRARVFLEGGGQESRTRSDDQGHYAFWNLPPGRYLVKARIERIHYLGQQVELGEDEQASVDLVAVGEAEVEGSISLGGDAARAAAWSPYFIDRRLILKELTDTGIAGGKELHLPVEGTFELKNIPAGTYEARAYLVVMVSPEPVPYYHSWPDRRCQVKFVSEPQIVRVVSGTRAAIHLSIAEACAPHYPIPDPATCDGVVPWTYVE